MKKALLNTQANGEAGSAVRVLHYRTSSHKTCFPLHWHDRMELIYIKKGRMYFTHGTESVEVGNGELVIVAPKVLHAGYTREETTEYDVLMFDIRLFYNETKLCKSLLPAIFEGKAVFHPVTSHGEIIACVKSLCGDVNHESLDTTANIYRLLSLLYQNALLGFRAQPINADIRKIMDYLEENATQELNIPQLCEEFGYTPAYLCRKFKRVTGLPPMNYLKIYRLELAQEKLRNSTASISSIAADCGFLDANYFTRCFKKHFGVSPIAYRREYADSAQTEPGFVPRK